jgi:hypothetical protein
MNRFKTILIVALTTALAISAVSVWIIFSSNSSPTKSTPLSTPELLFISNMSVPNSEMPNESYFNVTQGMTFSVNVTFTSMTSQPIEIPIENLTLSTYSSTINPKVWADTGNSSFVQDDVLSYSFSLNSVIVQPSSSNSTVLSIKFNNNAPAGQYYLDLRLGRAIMVNTQSQANYYSTLGVEVILLPNK